MAFCSCIYLGYMLTLSNIGVDEYYLCSLRVYACRPVRPEVRISYVNLKFILPAFFRFLPEEILSEKIRVNEDTFDTSIGAMLWILSIFRWTGWIIGVFWKLKDIFFVIMFLDIQLTGKMFIKSNSLKCSNNKHLVLDQSKVNISAMFRVVDYDNETAY